MAKRGGPGRAGVARWLGACWVGAVIGIGAAWSATAHAQEIPDAWARITDTDTLVVLLNSKGFETWGGEAKNWVKLVSKPDSVQKSLGVAHEVARYTVHCETGRLKITNSTLYRDDGSVYATRPDGEFRDPLLGSLGEVVMQQMCRDLEFRRPAF